MKSERGHQNGGSTELIAPGPNSKTASNGSLASDSSQPRSPTQTAPLAKQPRTAQSGAAADTEVISDADDDTTTFKSALSSSEAIRQREEPADGSPDVANVWAISDGPISGTYADSPGFRPAPVGSVGAPPDGAGSVENDSSLAVTSGPESLNMTPMEDDYYEDFTLPGTCEGVMSRQKSFRRRVAAAPVRDPEADRIESVVRAGELQRHGSIRRRLVEPSNSPTTPATDPAPNALGHHLREIEEMMDEPGEHISLNDIDVDHTSPPMSSSTPKAGESLMESGEQPLSLMLLSEDELLSLENVTVMKIRECLDKERMKDVYTISGRLQDILTQEEIQEILDNSEIFSQLLGETILSELRTSLQESLQNTSQDLSNNIVAADTSAPSSPQKTEDSRPSPPVPQPRTLSGAPQPSPRHRVALDPDLTSDPEIPHVVQESDGPASLPVQRTTPLQPEPGEEGEGTLLRTRSLRLGKSSQAAAVQGIFTETVSGPAAGRRRLEAPAVSLDDTEESRGEPVSPLESGGRQHTLSPADRDSPAESVPMDSVSEGADSGTEMGGSQRDLKSADRDSGVSEGQSESVLTDGQPTSEELAFQEVPLTAEPEAPEVTKQTDDTAADRPASLSHRRRKKISVAEEVLADDPEDNQSLSSLSQDGATPTEDGVVTSDLLDTLTPDDIDTPDELEESILERLPPADPVPEYTAQEELHNERSWRTCLVAGLERRIDMKVIEPYKKVLSHGGYADETSEQAIIVFSACYLPDRSRRDYSYVMDNLFLYVLTTLDALIADDYVLIYLHGATQRSCMPSFGWLKRCYQMIDRRLRKNLKGLYLVHPTFWVKTVVALARPFVSSKFSRKLRFVAGLRELSQLIPMDHVCIPDRVKQLDFELMIAERKRQLRIR